MVNREATNMAALKAVVKTRHELYELRDREVVEGLT